MKKFFYAFTICLLLIPAITAAWELPGKDIMKKIGVPGQEGQKPEVPTVSSPAAPTAAPALTTESKPVSQSPAISPDQADANACIALVHEDYKKSNKDLETSTLKWGSSTYLPKKEWVNYLKERYPNIKRDKNDHYIRFGKWYGKSCAYVILTCVPKEPGCTAQMKCLDFYTRKGGQTCPSNICEYNDKKCIEPYKSPAAQ